MIHCMTAELYRLVVIALSKMVKYLNQVETGIDNIVLDSADSIHMITELKPIETRLNEIKQILKKQEQISTSVQDLYQK